MSDFVNTVDTIGDTALLKRIIERTVTEYEDDKVYAVGPAAFMGCANLTKINLPMLTAAHERAFYNCGALTEVNVPMLHTTGYHAFGFCSALKKLELPHIKDISRYSFASCTALETVDISSYCHIGEYAFNSCSSLKTVILRHSTYYSVILATNVFNGTPIASGSGYIYVPSNFVDGLKTTDGFSTYANQIRAIEDYPAITGGWVV